MKNTLLLLLCLQLFLSCNGQSTNSSDTTYTKKLESALQGPVKEVSTYICKVENDKIPTNTANYYMKTKQTYDSLGNMTATHLKFRDSKTETSTFFSGTGKNVSCKTKSRLGDGEETESSYKIVWLDDYTYMINTYPDSPQKSNTVIFTLNKKFRLVKTVFKKRDKIWMIQEFEYNYSNNKLYEKINRITEYGNNGEKKLTYKVQIAKEYDRYGNPTLVYGYIDLEKQNLREVDFTTYTYYEH